MTTAIIPCVDIKETKYPNASQEFFFIDFVQLLYILQSFVIMMQKAKYLKQMKNKRTKRIEDFIKFFLSKKTTKRTEEKNINIDNFIIDHGQITPMTKFSDEIISQNWLAGCSAAGRLLTPALRTAPMKTTQAYFHKKTTSRRLLNIGIREVITNDLKAATAASSLRIIDASEVLKLPAN
uniref:Uncharacterized protein n=1 Tax=Glossina pallidipes TaxID=7398 RepID=A0A1A9ZJ87_GLOPL